MRRSRRIVFSLLLFLTPLFGQGQIGNYPPSILEINVTKTGPYGGIQQGKYLVPEIGAERLWKKVRIRKPLTQAVHMGFNYNIKYNILGYDAGYWLRPHRFGLTYGLNAFIRTDFDKTKPGLTPVLGYKIWFIHAQTGYHIMQRPTDFETNTFFVSVRMSIINDVDIDIKRDKKGIFKD